jgi:virulence factor Mce-like protein
MTLKPRLVGLLASGLALTAVALAFHPPQLPWNQSLRISLEAGSFGELNRGAGVELGGVRVGTVDGVRLQQGRALIDLSVDHAYAPLLHQDATASVRPHGLLGPRYVELHGGGAGGKLQDGALITADRVHVATDLDQVLNTFQPDVRDSLKVIFTEFGTAADGHGEDMNAAIAALAAAAQDLTTATQVLRDRRHDTGEFISASERLNRDLQYAPIDANIVDTDKVVSALARVESSLGGSIDHTAAVLQQLDIVMNGNSGNLSTLLQHAPATITLLRAVLAAQTELSEGITPGLPSLMTAVMETKSSFSGRDAYGNYVRVKPICTVPGPSCSGSPARSAGASGTTLSNGSASGAQSPLTGAQAAAGGGSLTDRQLVDLILGRK